VVLYSAGMLLAGMFPPTLPTATAAEIVDHYASNATPLRVGCVLMAFGAALIAPWAVAIAVQMRRRELGAPVLTYAALASAFFVAIDASLIPTVWAVASFRAGAVSPDITLTLNDTGWFMFEFPWQLGGGIWFVAVALSILTDSGDDPTYPRSIGWLSLWFCLLTFGDSLNVFFKQGPFAYNGLFTFYIPFSVLLAWVVVLTWATVRAIKRQADIEGRALVPATVPAAPT
jgi:hypothetical protein